MFFQFFNRGPDLRSDSGGAGAGALAALALTVLVGTYTLNSTRSFQSAKEAKKQDLDRDQAYEENLNALTIVAGLVRGYRPVVYLENYLQVTTDLLQPDEPKYDEAVLAVSPSRKGGGGWKLSGERTIRVYLPERTGRDDFLKVMKGKSVPKAVGSSRYATVRLKGLKNDKTFPHLITDMVFTSTVKMPDGREKSLTAQIPVEAPPQPEVKAVQSGSKVQVSLVAGVARGIKLSYVDDKEKKIGKVVYLSHKDLKSRNKLINAYSHEVNSKDVIYWEESASKEVDSGEAKEESRVRVDDVKFTNFSKSNCSYKVTFSGDETTTITRPGYTILAEAFAVDSDQSVQNEDFNYTQEPIKDAISDKIKNKALTKSNSGDLYKSALSCISRPGYKISGSSGRMDGFYQGHWMAEYDKMTGGVLPVVGDCWQACSNGWIAPGIGMYAVVPKTSGGCKKVRLRSRDNSCGCFQEDSRITLLDGTSKPISALTGDDILWNPVLKTGVEIDYMIRGEEELPLVRVNAGGEELVVTHQHPFPTPDGIRRAEQLRKGDRVMLANNRYVPVTAVQQVKADKKPVVWNIMLKKGPTEDHHMLEANGMVTGDLHVQWKHMRRGVAGR